MRYLCNPSEIFFFYILSLYVERYVSSLLGEWRYSVTECGLTFHRCSLGERLLFAGCCLLINPLTAGAAYIRVYIFY